MSDAFSQAKGPQKSQLGDWKAPFWLILEGLSPLDGPYDKPVAPFLKKRSGCNPLVAKFGGF